MGTVKFEPNGPTTFPDFSVGERICVECTRLVRSIENSGKGYVLDELEPVITKSLEGRISSIESEKLTKSYFVLLDLDVFMDYRAVGKKLETYLRELSDSNVILPHSHEVDETLTIEINSSSKRHEKPFLLGAVITRQSASWVLDELSQQTKDALSRKEKKAACHSHKYDELWLAVSSNLTIGLPQDYITFLKLELDKSRIWRRLLVIDPHRPDLSYNIELSPI